MRGAPFARGWLLARLSCFTCKSLNGCTPRRNRTPLLSETATNRVLNLVSPVKALGLMPAKKTKVATGDTKARPATGQPESARPVWPAMQLDRSIEDLSLRHLMPHQIVTVSDFWSAFLCKQYVSFLSSLPLVTTPGVPKKGDAVRVNDRFQIDDPAFAELLWSSTGLKDLVQNPEQLPEDDVAPGKASEEKIKQFWGGEVLGLNPNIRIYRYTKGQFFDQHCE